MGKSKSKGNKLTDGDNEGHKYLTVYRPYPMNADMDVEADRMAFAYWIASCIGRENLLAFFHKPKSPSMLIIEVNRALRNCTEILGEHRWSTFLRNPSDVEKTMSSKVFFCTYSTSWGVEKYGWKRIDLMDEWFISKESSVKWHRINNVIKYPYPPTERCDPPKEDLTRENLCRPLPSKHHPPPPPTRAPPVGSPAWQKAREAEARAPSNRAGTPHAQQQEYPISPRDNKTRNLAGWAQDRSSSFQATLPPGLVSPPSAITTPASRWSMGPPGLVRSVGRASSGSSESESGKSSPHTPQDDVPNETRS
ncbi:uncharacterized protein B0H18DRAFT_932180, partial [Fomitopsis serialis]|uniref:uncharacterized protein n=1 Tax=Fomitopsis serialis TaxID=139415 RepID=UPI0020078FBC